MKNPDRYVYYENVSKTRNGSFKKLHVPTKVVPVYACPEVEEKCPVSILDKYLSKLPKDAFKKDLFYVRPLSVVPTNSDDPWCTAVPIGRDLYTRSSMTCVLEQESRERKQITASEPPVQHRCTKVESLKKSFKRGLDIALSKPYGVTNRDGRYQNFPLSIIA